MRERQTCKGRQRGCIGRASEREGGIERERESAHARKRERDKEGEGGREQDIYT